MTHMSNPGTNSTVSTVTQTKQYDAAGQVISFTSVATGDLPSSNSGTFESDADGQIVKQTAPNTVTYLIRSSLLGGKVLLELTTNYYPNGTVYYTNNVTSVYVGNEVFARLNYRSDFGPSVSVKRADPLKVNIDNKAVDPMGVTIDAPDWERAINYYNSVWGGLTNLSQPGLFFRGDGNNANPGDYATGCVAIIDGVPGSCDKAKRLFNNGWVNFARNHSPDAPWTVTGHRNPPLPSGMANIVQIKGELTNRHDFSDASFITGDLFETGQQSQQETEAQRRQRLFNEAAQAIRNILSGDNPCSRFFGAFGLSAFNQMIQNATFSSLENENIGIRQNVTRQIYHRSSLPILGENPGGTPYYAYYAPNSFAVNTSGAFFNTSNNLPRFGGFDPGSLGSRIIQLLHELGHVTVASVSTRDLPRNLIQRGYVRGELLLREDGDDPGLSGRNTETVRRNCINEINRIINPPQEQEHNN
jgi:hypothetical protein